MITKRLCTMIFTLTFLFFIGSVSGWIIEVFFRRFISPSNPQRRWINPGFCTGPYLPLYGCGLCLLYVIANLENLKLIENPFWNKTVLFVVMAVSMTVLEYIAGFFNLKGTKVRLWDYSNEWGNLQGIICPKFSLIWAALCACYYFLIHSHIVKILQWICDNPTFYFAVGMFFGIFIIDVSHSAQLVVRLKKYAEENGVIIRYEAIKAHIRSRCDDAKLRYHFFRPFRSDRPLSEHLKELRDSFDTHKKTSNRKDT